MITVAEGSQRAYLHEAYGRDNVGSLKKKEESNPRLLSLVLVLGRAIIVAVLQYEAIIRREAIHTGCIDFFFYYNYNWSDLAVGTHGIDSF